MSGFESCLYKNDNVCFVLKGAENLPARGRKTEKNIALALLPVHTQMPLLLRSKLAENVPDRDKLQEKRCGVFISAV
jgi:hypothetical protein